MSLFDIGLINGLLDSGTREINKVLDYQDNYDTVVTTTQPSAKEEVIVAEEEPKEEIKEIVEIKEPEVTTDEPVIENELVTTFDEPFSYSRKKKNGRFKKLLNRKF